MRASGSGADSARVVTVAALLAQGTAIAVYFVLIAADLDGCDRGDSAAGAAGIGFLVDCLLVLGLATAALVRTRRITPQIVVAVPVSLLVAVGLLALGIARANAWATECPV